MVVASAIFRFFGLGVSAASALTSFSVVVAMAERSAELAMDSLVFDSEELQAPK